jgi:hypothetical protein
VLITPFISADIPSVAPNASAESVNWRVWCDLRKSFKGLDPFFLFALPLKPMELLVALKSKMITLLSLISKSEINE